MRLHLLEAEFLALEWQSRALDGRAVPSCRRFAALGPWLMRRPDSSAVVAAIKIIPRCYSTALQAAQAARSTIARPPWRPAVAPLLLSSLQLQHQLCELPSCQNPCSPSAWPTST